MDNMDKFSSVSDLELVTKMISLIVKNNQVSLTKRREQRIQFLKKETQLLKSAEDERKINHTLRK